MSHAPCGQLGVEQLVGLVDGHATGRPRTLAVGQALDGRLLDVELVDDLADQLLDEVLERDQPGRAAVLVDHDRQVELAVLHLAEQAGDAAWSRARSGPPGRGPAPASAPWPARSARIRSFV